MYKLYIFDFDGTLADSGAWMVRTLNEMAPLFGVRQASDDDIEMLRGKSNRDIVRYFRVPAWKMPRIARYVRRRMGEDAEQIALFDGVPAMLAAVKDAGVRVAVVSSNSEANIRRILGDAAGIVDDYACGAGLFGKARKFRKVIRAAGVLGSETLCIGDETRDIEAARQAGAAAGAVTWGYATRQILETFAPAVMFAAVADIVPEPRPT